MRKPAMLLGTLALIVPLTPARGAPGGSDAAALGVFGSLFDDPNGGADCTSADQHARCKPTANAVAQLPDGRQIYWSGLEGMNGIDGTVVSDYGTTALNSGVRILDLRGGAPRFSSTNPFDGGLNPQGNPDNEYLPGPLHNDDVVTNDGDLFCADLKFLADGRVLTNGGTSYYQEPGIPGHSKPGIVELNGLKNTAIFDPRTDRWSQVGKMNWARWYPTMVTQADGSILTFGGVTKLIKPIYPNRPGDSFANERHVERFDPSTGRWTDLPNSAKKSLPLFPRMHLLPDGRTLYNAAGQVFDPMGGAWDEATWNFTSVFDPRTNTWKDLGLNDFAGLPLGFRGTGISMMLMLKPGETVARFLSVGGVPGTTPGTYIGQAATTITEFDTANDGFRSHRSGDLHTPRWFTDGVMLPTGGVWIVNGGDRDHLMTPGAEYANLTTELYDPAAGSWTVTPSQAHGRSYHSTAMLLPDGRVLVGGHAPVGTLYGRPTDMPHRTFGTSISYADPSFQIYSPPYLFWGRRPVITGVNPQVTTGQILSVRVDKPAEVTSVHLLRNTSLTHLVDADQRNVELQIVGRTAAAVQVRVPGNTYLPPGPYLLFAHRMSDRGEIPSVARQVFVDAHLTVGQVQALITRAAAQTRAELSEPPAPVSTTRAAVPGPAEVAAPAGTATRTTWRRGRRNVGGVR